VLNKDAFLLFIESLLKVDMFCLLSDFSFKSVPFDSEDKNESLFLFSFDLAVTAVCEGRA
jgi:hypothetical protein